MRTYATDSRQAAARIVALTLICDGHVSKTELDLLERVGAYPRLGIDRAEMLAVLQAYCDDLLQARHPHWVDACQVDLQTLGQLLAEVEDPTLRMTVLTLCAAVADADGHVADGESIVLANAVEQWGLQREMVRPAVVGGSASPA